MSNIIWEKMREDDLREQKNKGDQMNKEEVLETMCDRNHKGDKSVCIGAFTIDYIKDEDQFYLTYPTGFVRKLSLEDAVKYMGLEKSSYGR